MTALWFVLMFLLLQQIEGNLIYPHVVGNSIGLRPIWTLAAVVLGQGMFGIVGMPVSYTHLDVYTRQINKPTFSAPGD